MINRMRSSVSHSLVALALAGLTNSAPVQAVELAPETAAPVVETNVEALEAVVEALPVRSAEPAAEAVPEAEAAPKPAYEIVGEGEASYYGYELAGNRTASGERFNPRAMTAAHRSLPLGTKLRVTNLSNGRSVVVRINDRGPFAKARILDLSLGAAEEIRMVRAGKARVKLERLRSTA